MYWYREERVEWDKHEIRWSTIKRTFELYQGHRKVNPVKSLFFRESVLFKRLPVLCVEKSCFSDTALAEVIIRNLLDRDNLVTRECQNISFFFLKPKTSTVLTNYPFPSRQQLENKSIATTPFSEYRHNVALSLFPSLSLKRECLRVCHM